jgi:para-nitrobenzyl esterase
MPLAGGALAADRIKTTSGVVEGTGRQDSGVRMFKGIPFAEPPIGELRWKAPQPLKTWRGVRPATQFGPRCMQQPVFGDMNFRSNGMSEDCLYLNVWTPARSAGDRLPVLVYFYGGGFRAGDGSEPRYDGESMARRGIVALTVNYRLAEFGFFAHPALTAESPVQASGNQGFLDQTAALQWVKRNIAAFGGDPSQVTIAGESAGSISVRALMASPVAKTLFARAIGESGGMFGPTIPPVPLADAERIGTQFAASADAASLEALRALSTQEIVDAAKRAAVAFPTTIDGYFLTKLPAEVFAAGSQAHVPLLAGSNSQELGARQLLGTDPPTLEGLEQAIRRQFTVGVDEVLSAYLPSKPDEVDQAATDLASDRFIAYSTWKWMESPRPLGRQSGLLLLLFARPARDDRCDGQRGSGSRQRSHHGHEQYRHASGRPRGAVHSAEIECTRWQPRHKQGVRLDAGRFPRVAGDAGLLRQLSGGNPNGSLAARRRRTSATASRCASTSSRVWNLKRGCCATRRSTRLCGK